MDAVGHARLIIGGARALDEVARVAGSARTRLTGELFKLTDRAVVDAVTDAAGDGVKVRLLADPEFAGSSLQSTDELAAAGVRLLDDVQLPGKVHAKHLTADGKRSVITTAAWIGESRERLDVAFTVSGTPSALLEQLTLATGDPRRTRELARALARRGVLVNDALAGVDELTQGLSRLVGSAEREVVVGTKLLHSRAFARKLAAAADRGVDVLAAARKVATPEQEILDAAGAAHAPIPRGDAPFHANIVIADDLAYVGTAHLSNRALGLSNGRASRELGIIIDDPGQVAQLRQLVLGRLQQPS